jgi:hypothetical protein
VWFEEVKLTNVDIVDLDRPFTREEVRNIVFLMEQNEAPIPDGIPIKFYQACCIVKSDMLNVLNDLHQHKINLARINYGIIFFTQRGRERIQ